MSNDAAKLKEELEYAKGVLSGSDMQVRVLHVVIERLLKERESETPWDRDVRNVYPTLLQHAAVHGLTVSAVAETAMLVADVIQKGREERAKAAAERKE